MQLLTRMFDNKQEDECRASCDGEKLKNSKKGVDADIEFRLPSELIRCPTANPYRGIVQTNGPDSASYKEEDEGNSMNCAEIVSIYSPVSELACLIMECLLECLVLAALLRGEDCLSFLGF